MKTRTSSYARLPKTVEETWGLIEVDFDYVCDVEGVRLFRRCK